MAIATIQTGMITALERQILIRPKNNITVPRYPILYTHGAGAQADAMLEYGNACHRTQKVADRGIVGVSGDFGGTQTWGNDKAQAAMTDAFNWLQTQPGVKPGKVAIAGGSMGGLNALVWAAANPTKVSCISIYIPVLNPSQIHDQNLSGYAGAIDGCYPPSGWTDALKPTKDPLHMAGLGKYDTGIPMKIHFGLQDALCLPENAWAFCERVATAEAIPFTGGHEQATELQVDRDAEANFIFQNSI